MKVLTPRIHGFLDCVVVLVFLAAPMTLGFSNVPATLAYALSAIHLLLTLVTAFPVGVIKLIPLKVHGVIELVVAFALLGMPWALGFDTELPARNFYLGAGIVIFLTWLITDYTASERA